MKSTIKTPTQPENEKPQFEDTEPDEYEKHEIEHACRTLTEAEGIKQKPKLHGHAMKHLKGQHAAMSAAMGHTSSKKPGSLKELRQIAAKKSAEIDDAG